MNRNWIEFEGFLRNIKSYCSHTHLTGSFKIRQIYENFKRPPYVNLTYFPKSKYSDVYEINLSHEDTNIHFDIYENGYVMYSFMGINSFDLFKHFIENMLELLQIEDPRNKGFSFNDIIDYQVTSVHFLLENVTHPLSIPSFEITHSDRESSKFFSEKYQSTISISNNKIKATMYDTQYKTTQLLEIIDLIRKEIKTTNKKKMGQIIKKQNMYATCFKSTLLVSGNIICL